MPELAEIVTELLDGTQRSISQSEREHLLSHVRAVVELAGEQPGTEDILRLLEQGWLPDYFVTNGFTLVAQLVMQTARERRISGSGGITWGPLRLDATLQTSLMQSTQTNLQVELTCVRQSRSRGLAYIVSELAPPRAETGELPDANPPPR